MRHDETPTVPPWTLGWRLQRALSWADMTTAAMADVLDVDRSTISRWVNDKGAPPRRIYLERWAQHCRVPLDWLMTGDMDGNSPDTLVTGKYRAPADQPADSIDPPSVAEIKSYIRRGIGHTAVVHVTGGDMS